MADEKKTLKEKAAEEFRLFLLIAAYLAIFFVAFVTYRKLISRELGVGYFKYGYALLEALIVAKIILLGKAMGVGQGTERRTLAVSVVRASIGYGALVAAFEVLEKVIEGLIHGKTLGASLEDFASRGVDEMLGRAVILMVAFLPFFALWELSRLMGDRKLSEIFFKKGAGEAGH